MAERKYNPDQQLVAKVPKKPAYTQSSWKGVQTVFKCSTCGEDRDDQDMIILHVLTHVPESGREALLDQLLKEK